MFVCFLRFVVSRRKGRKGRKERRKEHHDIMRKCFQTPVFWVPFQARHASLSVANGGEPRGGQAVEGFRVQGLIRVSGQRPQCCDSLTQVGCSAAATCLITWTVEHDAM